MAAAMWNRCQKLHLKFLLLNHARRSQKNLAPCCYSTQVLTVDETVEYPPIKPQFPLGDWGYMTPQVAWQWHDEMENFRKTVSVRERLNRLSDVPERPVWKLRTQTKDPYMLPYQQYLTKTHLIKGLPEVFDAINVDDELEILRPVIIDSILFENGALDRKKCFSRLKGNSWNHPSTHCRYFVGQILQTLMSGLSMSGKCDYLLGGQYDECVQVAAHWHRHGIRMRGKHRRNTPRPSHAPIQTDYLADCQIRIQKPIAPFVLRDDPVCREGEYPDYGYDPVVMGLHSVFSKPSIVAGHWPEDPCPFSLVSAHTTNLIERDGARFNADIVNDMKIGFGLISAFGSQVAHAHYQGFNMYLDLTYPFCGQSILTNGKTFSFIAYQLNTLHLWKDDQSNPFRNICWHMDEMNLFDVVENGEVKGFNDDVLKTILRFLMNAPRSDAIDLKPSFGDGFLCPELPWPYIPDKPPPPPPKEEQPLYVA